VLCYKNPKTKLIRLGNQKRFFQEQRDLANFANKLRFRVGQGK